MVLTQNAVHQNDGWQIQANRLSSTHGVLGVTAITLADKARKARRQSLSQATPHCADATSSESEYVPPISANQLTTELDAARAKVAALEIQLERKTKLAARVQQHLDAWQERATIAESTIADLENDLNDARAVLSFAQNESCSLQTSLDLVLSESSRQSQCLVEKQATVDHAQCELAALRADLAAVETERDKLLAAIRETKELHQAETDNLKARVASMTAAAAAAEQLLERLRRSMIEKLKLIHTSNGANDRRVQELEHRLARLTAGSNALLTTFRARELALANADEKINFLAERIAQLEADANVPKAPAGIRTEDGTEELVLSSPILELIAGSNALLTTFRARELALADADEKINFLAERIAQLEADANAPKAPAGIRTNAHPDTSIGRTVVADGTEELVLSSPILELKSNGHGGHGDAISDAPYLSFTAGLLAETIAF